MQPLDYGRSFLIGTWPKNEVRFWVESRTRIVDEEAGREEDYIQTGSCKSEDTFAERDLFSDPNYDFLPIFGPEYGVIFRRRAESSASYKSCPRSDAMWGGVAYHLVEAEAAEELTPPAAIIAATHAFDPIVAQTEIWDDATGLRAILEYPVKTLNTNRERGIYQIDTGPIAFPDLSQRYEGSVDALSLAFVAFNVPHFADFVVEEPTAIGDGSVSVHHYSRRVSLPARNRVYAQREGRRA